MITFAGQGTSLVLPSPKLGDKEHIDLRFNYKRMMDGTVRSYKTGNPIISLEFEFQNINRPKILEVVTFVRSTEGKIITYTDYNNLVQTGRLMNLPYDFVHTAIRDNTFSLRFELNG